MTAQAAFAGSAECAATARYSTTTQPEVTGDPDGDSRAAQDGDAGTTAHNATRAGCGAAGRRRARGMPAAGATAPHRHRHGPGRAGARPVRAHPRLGLRAVR